MVRKGVWIAVIIGIVAACGTGIRARAAGDILAAGATAPDFSLPSQEDASVSLSQYKGKWVVLYFYPKDMTTGCTIEAHNFQRDLPKYNALNAVVLGVSLDTVESHKTFCTKDSLTFKLLADPDHKVIDAYGVPISGMGQHPQRRRSRRHRRLEWRSEGRTQAVLAASRRKKARTSREESGPFCLPGCYR